MEINELRSILHAGYPSLDAVAIKVGDLVFEERVRLKCFHCSNYRTKWTCPGHLPPLDFRKLVGEYEHLAVIVSAKPAVNGKPSADEYRLAGNELHKAMLYLESELMKRNLPLAQSFIGGSCELCDDGCPTNACAHPGQARIPWDAAGCNVVRSLANIGIRVDFTGKEICRYGLFMW